MSGLVRSGVGSLPHVAAAEAADFVFATADVPYLPQLPNRHPEESMLLQWGDGIAGAGPDGRLLASNHQPGPRHEAFLGAAEVLHRFPGGVLKTQATGPVTLAAALRAGGVDSGGLLERVAADLTDRLSEHLSWIREEAEVDDLVLMLDEPALAAMDGTAVPGRSAVFDVLATVMESVDAEVGIHCCADTDWGAIAALRPDWLSWDLSALGEGFFAGLDQIAEAFGAGTRLMWGIVPTTPGPLPDQNVILGRYGTAVANLVVAGAPFESLKERAWFTPACGLAGLSVADAEAVAKLLEVVVGDVEDGW